MKQGFGGGTPAGPDEGRVAVFANGAEAAWLCCFVCTAPRRSIVPRVLHTLVLRSSQTPSQRNTDQARTAPGSAVVRRLSFRGATATRNLLSLFPLRRPRHLPRTLHSLVLRSSQTPSLRNVDEADFHPSFRGATATRNLLLLLSSVPPACLAVALIFAGPLRALCFVCHPERLPTAFVGTPRNLLLLFPLRRPRRSEFAGRNSCRSVCTPSNAPSALAPPTNIR